MADAPNAFLHIYEVEIEGKTVHLVGFLGPEVAEREGIHPHKVVGEFRPDPQGDFDPKTFQPNPHFVDSLVAFLNEQALHDEELMLLAGSKPGESIWLADPRHPHENGAIAEPPPTNVVGRYKVDPDGFFEPEPFEYNAKHLWFDEEQGPSGVFENQRFYEWLNA